MRKYLSLLVLVITLFPITSCTGRQGLSPKTEAPDPEIAILQQQLSQVQEELTEAEATIARQQANLDEFALQVTNSAEQRNQTYTKLTELQRRYDSLLAKQNPWPGLYIYADPDRTVNVKTGEKFLIWYDLDNEMFIVSLDEFHDDALIKSVAKIGAYHDISDQRVRGVGWFLFEALTPGSTQITVQHTGHLLIGVEDVETFDIVITD